MLFLAIPGQLTANTTSRSSFPLWSCFTSGSCVPPLCHTQTMPTGLCSKIYQTHHIRAKESILPQTLLAGSVLSFCSSSVSPPVMDGSGAHRSWPSGAVCSLQGCAMLGHQGSSRPWGQVSPRSTRACRWARKPERGLHQHLERQRLPDLLQTHLAFAINDGNGKLIWKHPTHNVWTKLSSFTQGTLILYFSTQEQPSGAC